MGPLLPALGITRVANVTGLDRIGIPVVMVCRPNARSLAVSQGKGLALEAAKASGIMESIELHHAELAAELPTREGDRVPGRDLLRETEVWVPLAVIDLDTTHMGRAGGPPLAVSTTGLASGNVAAESLSHGVCEVVERDAASRWRRLSPTERQTTRVSLRTVDERSCRALLDRYEDADVAVSVWDLTPPDVRMAVFCCEIVDRGDTGVSGRQGGGGYGAHPDRGVALARALTEAAQSRLTSISGAREDIAVADYDVPPVSVAGNYRDHLLGLMAPRDFLEVPTFEASTIDDDLDHVLRLLADAGVAQVVAVDLTRPDVGVPVVKVIVPGFEDADHGPAA